MTTEKKGEGERKGGPGRKKKGPQTMPLILSETRNRVSRELPMDGETATLIDSYTSWASKKGGISKDEATILLLGKAVPAFIKRDSLFQQEGSKDKAPAPSDSTEA